MSELYVIFPSSDRTPTSDELHASLAETGRVEPEADIVRLRVGDAWATFELRDGAIAAHGDLELIRRVVDRSARIAGPQVIHSASGAAAIRVGGEDPHRATGGRSDSQPSSTLRRARAAHGRRSSPRCSPSRHFRRFSRGLPWLTNGVSPGYVASGSPAVHTVAANAAAPARCSSKSRVRIPLGTLLVWGCAPTPAQRASGIFVQKSSNPASSRVARACHLADRYLPGATRVARQVRKWSGARFVRPVRGHDGRSARRCPS